ncbi:hypothetical protein [Octadecabacter antarcticus]|uniref:hypothetical protein n=1 Tax=Octadecabacter antarcticus TaxID=1217908 RepID=UPI0001806A6F|nr:hypothetical protein [Octadecabacter antarcticus]
MVDLGTHNLDLRSPSGAAFYEHALRDNIVVTDVHNWATTTDRTWTRGFEMPDFGVGDTALCATAMRELTELCAAGAVPSGDGYDAWLLARFGPALVGR